MKRERDAKRQKASIATTRLCESSANFLKNMMLLLIFLVFVTSMGTMDDRVRSKVSGHIGMLHNNDLEHELPVFNDHIDLEPEPSESTDHNDLELELSEFTYYDKSHQKYSDILTVLTDLLPTQATTVIVLAVIAYCAMVYAIVQFRRELTVVRQENQHAAKGISYLEHRLQTSQEELTVMRQENQYAAKGLSYLEQRLQTSQEELTVMRQENQHAAKGLSDLEDRLEKTQEVNRFLLRSLEKMGNDIASLPQPTAQEPFDPEPYRAEYWDQYRYLYALINQKTETLNGMVQEHYQINGSACYHLQYSVDFLMSDYYRRQEYYRGQEASVEMCTQTSQPDVVPRGILKNSGMESTSTSKKSVHFI